MTAKEYQTIANVFDWYASAGNSQNAELMRQQLAKSLARRLEEQNPRFDMKRFLAACGVKSGE